MKTILYAMGAVCATFLMLVGIVFFVGGIAEKITSMAIVGLFLLVISFIIIISIGKKNAKNRTINKSYINCLVCGQKDRVRKNTIHTSNGSICRKCMIRLSLLNISEVNINKYDVDELKVKCGYLDKRQMIINSENSLEEKLKNLVVDNPPISLLDNEVCYYQGKATAYHEKNVVTGRKSGGAGVSVRVAKGVSVRTGGGTSQVIRENVGEYFEGTLYITNFRIILLAPKYGFDLHISKITQLSYNTDGFQVYAGSKCYSVLSKDIKVIQDLVLFLNKHTVFKDEKIINNKAKSTDKRDAAALREFKKLFDDGIITQEEFEAKKKQLLGI